MNIGLYFFGPFRLKLGVGLNKFDEKTLDGITLASTIVNDKLFFF